MKGSWEFGFPLHMCFPDLENSSDLDPFYWGGGHRKTWWFPVLVQPEKELCTRKVPLTSNSVWTPTGPGLYLFLNSSDPFEPPCNRGEWGGGLLLPSWLPFSSSETYACCVVTEALCIYIQIMVNTRKWERKALCVQITANTNLSGGAVHILNRKQKPNGGSVARSDIRPAQIHKYVQERWLNRTEPPCPGGQRPDPGALQEASFNTFKLN